MEVKDKIETIRVALAGNPNAGKSTLFNALTGGHAHVGNWPGVTVEKKEGRMYYKDYEFIITDLPGTYSLTSYSIDERIARDYVVKGTPDVVVAVIDATNIERNLYLAISLLELGANVVIDLNMADELKRMNVKVDTKKMEEILGAPVVLTSAVKGEGLLELKEAIIEARDEKKEALKINYGEDIEQVISKIEQAVHGTDISYPKRFFAIKLLEGDGEFIKVLKEKGRNDIVELATKEASGLESKFGYDLETEIIERRYGFIEGITKRCVSRSITTEE